MSNIWRKSIRSIQHVYYKFFLFWPIDKWPNFEINLVFDDENPLDHRMATVLAHLPPYPNIYFEKKPTQKTFCSNWNREG